MNWLDAQRAEMVTEAFGRLSLPVPDPLEVPEEKRLTVREALIQILEEKKVCSREAVRIADVWSKGREAPSNWRYA